MERLIAVTVSPFSKGDRNLVYYNAETVYCLLKYLKKMVKFYKIFDCFIFPKKYVKTYITKITKMREWYYFGFLRILTENNLSNKTDELIIATSSIKEYTREGKMFTSYYYNLELYKILPYKKVKGFNEIELGNTSFMYRFEIKEFTNRVEVKLYPHKYLEKYWIKRFKSLNELKQFNTFEDLRHYVQEKGKIYYNNFSLSIY